LPLHPTHNSVKWTSLHAKVKQHLKALWHYIAGCTCQLAIFYIKFYTAEFMLHTAYLMQCKKLPSTRSILEMGSQ